MEASGQQAPPEFLSTHPSYDTRIENIRSWLPEAMQYYEQSKHVPVKPLHRPKS